MEQDLLMDEEEQYALDAIKHDLKKRNLMSNSGSMDGPDTSYESIIGTSKAFKDIRSDTIS